MFQLLHCNILLVDAISDSPRTLNLALQGGGSHGAFTWGALDRLLEAPDIRIEAISGTSSGAINAALLAQGYMDGGRKGAREALAAFWKQVASTAAPTLAHSGYQPDWLASASAISPVMAAMLPPMNGWNSITTPSAFAPPWILRRRSLESKHGAHEPGRKFTLAEP